MRKLAITTLLAISISFAIQEGYQLQDMTKFLKGTDGTTKSVRYISVSRYNYQLNKTGTGTYDITSYGWKVAERKDIDLNGLGELREVKITDPWEFGYQNYEKTFATLHLTREQKAQFRQDPQGYVNQLNQELISKGYTYRAEYKIINQKDPRTGNINQVPKLILR
ncbi:MAG: hypothetical protein QXN96_02690 [Candidatus Bathyarchaeia archaeon]